MSEIPRGVKNGAKYNPAMTFPQLTATEQEIQQTRRICELRGWRYYSSTDARTEDAHIYDRAGREETLAGGRFSLDHVVMMLEAEGYRHYMLTHEAQKEIIARGWIGAQIGYLNVRTKNFICAAAHDLTAAMDALLALEERKGAEKP